MVSSDKFYRELYLFSAKMAGFKNAQSLLHAITARIKANGTFHKKKMVQAYVPQLTRDNHNFTPH
jgi:hypothetical protein